MDWLQNIGQWFVNNKDVIITFITGIDFTALLTMLWGLYKQHKAITNNTLSTNALNANLKQNEMLQLELTSLKNEIEDTKNENMSLKTAILDLQYIEKSLVNKLNAMLDVQSIVYATIKDENTRATVNSILTNAKYAENTTKAKLREELENLKKIVSEQSKASEQQVKDVVANAEAILENTKNEINMRY